MTDDQTEEDTMTDYVDETTTDAQDTDLTEYTDEKERTYQSEVTEVEVTEGEATEDEGRPVASRILRTKYLPRRPKDLGRWMKRCMGQKWKCDVPLWQLYINA